MESLLVNSLYSGRNTKKKNSSFLIIQGTKPYPLKRVEPLLVFRTQYQKADPNVSTMIREVPLYCGDPKPVTVSIMLVVLNCHLTWTAKIHFSIPSASI